MRETLGEASLHACGLEGGPMNTVVAQFKIIAGKEAEAEEAMKKQAGSVESAEPGALTYIFHRNQKDPTEITVFEIYADDEAVQTHRSTEHMATFGSYFGSMFDRDSVKIVRLERIAGFSR
jgi:quinol monooxygenase YgiN